MQRHELQTRIMDYLLDHQEGATLYEIALHLGLSPTATREHLSKLDNEGFVSHHDTRRGVGRPRRRYVLTADGHQAFPKQYSWLSSSMLELLAQKLGKPAVAQLMSDLADKVSSTMMPKSNNDSTTAETLVQIAAKMNELGYRAKLRQSDLRKGAILEASNCVYHTVAMQHSELCRFDIRLLENLSQLDVKLEACIARGDSICRFCFRKKSSINPKEKD